eukprot:symbB.v1.2.013378.t1/scaffold947.1/size149738/3
MFGFNFMRRKMVQSSDQSGEVLPSMPPEQFRVELHRQGDQPIGIRAAWTSEQEGLVIYDVRENGSVVKKWNEVNEKNPEMQIRAGLAILEVNGERSPERMLHHLKRTMNLEITLSRFLSQMQRRIVKEAKKQEDAVESVLCEVQVAEAEPCAICFQDMMPCNCNPVELPCGHRFHRPCIRQWLVQGATKKCLGRCPLCNQRPELPGAVDSDSD